MDNQPLFRPSWCEMDLSAVQHNTRALRSVIGEGVKIYMCLKSDACGGGAVAVAAAASQAGVDGFAFGNVDKAIECRATGIQEPILVYPSSLPEAAPAFAQHKLMPTLSTVEEVDLWNAAAGETINVFLKIDSGSFRAGAFPHEALSAAVRIAAAPRLQLAGVYGHTMGSYGFSKIGYDLEQFDAFMKALENITASGITPAIRMASSSATVLKYPEADLNGVDPGRLLMGIPFDAIDERNIEVRPVLTAIKSKIILIKDTADINSVPFPPFFNRPAPKKIGIVPFGWGDGFPSAAPGDTYVLLSGQKAPVITPIHSEIMRIDLTDIPSATIGDEVVLLGRSGDSEIKLADLIDTWGMDHFSIQNTVGQNLRKIYVPSRD